MKIFRFLDDFIVVIAKAVIRAVFAVGTGLVYIQFIGGLLLTLALGDVSRNRRKFRHPDATTYSARRSLASSISNVLGLNGPPSHSTSSRRRALRWPASTLSMSP